MDLLREKQPVPRYTSPEYFNAPALFRSSSDAAEMMTGEALPMNGGWLAQ